MWEKCERCKTNEAGVRVRSRCGSSLPYLAVGRHGNDMRIPGGQVADLVPEQGLHNAGLLHIVVVAMPEAPLGTIACATAEGSAWGACMWVWPFEEAEQHVGGRARWARQLPHVARGGQRISPGASNLGSLAWGCCCFEGRREREG